MRMFVVPFAVLLLAAGAGTPAQAADDAKKEVDLKDAEKRMEAARKKMEEAAREMAELSAQAGFRAVPNGMVFLGRNPNRAMLGIGIGNESDGEREDGVAVLSVSPGGPASAAGLKAGDVIVELNGKNLKKDKEDSSREKLLDAMGKLSPGDDANVRYTRDGKAAVVKLKVDRLPREETRAMRMVTPSGERGPHDRNFDFDFDFDGLTDNFRVISNRGVLGDLEMLTLTPTMGQYFGVEKGLLIVRAPKDNKDVQLEDGDVLLDIDGRAPTDPGHAYRILRSYQPGEKLTLNVMRQRKKIAVAVTTPQRSERGGRPAPVTMPLPGFAPTPPPAPGTAVAPAPATPAPAPTKRMPIT